MLRVLLVGVDYFPHVGTGDKNFWFNIIPLLNSKLDYLAFASFNYQKSKLCFQEPNISIHTLKPFRFSKNDDLKCGINFNYFDKSITILKALKELKMIIQQHNINLIHFIDNFGPLTSIIKKNLPEVYTTISVMGSHPHRFLYDTVLRLSVCKFDKIVTYSDAINRKLISLGIQNSKLKTIRWGVDTSIPKTNFNETKEIKNKLNVGYNSKIILWTGYTQQTNYNDFLITLNAAQETVKHINSCHFLFAFKPEHFKQSYLNYTEDRISILSNINIKDVFNVADLLVSPISAKNSIVAPPLTWLEALSYEIPIITTNVGGVDEVIINGRNGFITSTEKLKDTIIDCLNDKNMDRMSQNARKLVQQKYDIKNSANEYINLWRTMIDG